jgi:recombination protein RecA
MSDVTYETISALVASINKKHGESVLIRGSEMREEIIRTTTGILAFDLMLGGGWPANQWSEIIGEASSGKTAIAYKTIAANQALNPEWTALWIAAEHYVPQYAKAIGVDLDRLWVLETNVMETVYDIILRALENRAVDCIVIDSLPALVPGEEAERLMSEFTVGVAARLNNKFFRKSGKAKKRSNIHEDRPCTCLVINQWREKIGVMYGDNRTTPGGKGKDFEYFTRVEVRRDEWIKVKDEAVGQSIKARTIKNKTYRPQQVAVVDFYFADTHGFQLGDFDTIKDVVNICITIEALKRAGAYYSYGDQKWQGKDAVLQAVREDITLQNELKSLAFDYFLSSSK